MFERFTHEARNIVVLAQRESRALSHSYIGTEHLLLALALDRDATGDILRGENLTHPVLYERVIATIGRGLSAPSGHTPFTPRARVVLELANEVSLSMGHGHIGPEHIALALLQAEDGVSGQVLKSLGASGSSLRRQFTASLAGTYTAGLVFHGFTATTENRYDLHPLRSTAEKAADDAATGDGLDVRAVTIALHPGEYFLCLDAEPQPDTGRYLDYHRVRTVAGLTRGRVHIAVPRKVAVTAQTASGSEVVIAETLEWNVIPLSDRVEVVEPATD